MGKCESCSKESDLKWGLQTTRDGVKFDNYWFCSQLCAEEWAKKSKFKVLDKVIVK